MLLPRAACRVTILIFLLQFFPWVGVYPCGGYAAATENAWGAAFGSANDDPNYKNSFHFTTDADAKAKDEKERVADNRPGVSLLTILYLLAFFPTAALTLAAVAIGYVPIKLPPAVQPFLQWKWAILFLLNLLLFFVLALQLLAGFSLESKMKEWAEAEAKKEEPAQKRDTVQETHYNVIVGQKVGMVQRTSWLALAVWLHVLVVVTALLLFWLSQRARFNKPLPELSLRW